MPIDTRCPNCQKQYKLKDELGGKSVKCSNPDCRQVFTITAKPNGKPAKKSSKQIEADAEAEAARVLSEAAEDTKPAAERTVTVECYNCNFKWPEPQSKAGKFALCPECRTRNKVPELKKAKAADWRDTTAGRRAAEKAPDLPEDLEAQQLRHVDVESLKQAGAIEAPEVEPRPLRDYVLFITVPLVVLGLAAGGVWWLLQMGRQAENNTAMAEAMKSLDDLKDIPEPPASEQSDDARARREELAKVSNDQRRLMRAALDIADGEYQARLNTKEGIREAVKAFSNARRELEASPKTAAERDVLFGELAVAQVSLGGTDEQANTEVRLHWSPQETKGKGPPMGSTAVDYVQSELRQTLTRMVEGGKEVDKGVRLATLVRLARALVKAGHPDILYGIAAQAFASPEDQAEGQAITLLAALLAGADEAGVRRQAEPMKEDPTLAAAWPSAALFDRLGLSDGKSPVKPEGNWPLGTRLVFAAKAIAQRNQDEAVRIVTAPGDVGSRLPAMAAVAELLDDPKPVLEKAVEVAGTAGNGYRFYLYRLARVAGDAKAADAADVFARGVTDDGLRDMALAEAARGKWAAMTSAVPASDLTMPTDPNKLRVGQGWVGYLFARHNAAATRDQSAAKEFDAWGDGKLRGFGYAGLALGLQDGK